MMYWGNHMGAGGWIFSILASLIFLALIGALIFWLLSATTSGGGNLTRTGSRESPKEILDRRLASGELTVEQYRHLHDTLDGAGQPSAPPAPREPQTPPPRAAGAASE